MINWCNYFSLANMETYLTMLHFKKLELVEWSRSEEVSFLKNFQSEFVNLFKV